MKEIYPEFDIFELEDDVKTIFITVYEEFLNGNQEYIEKVCASGALGYFQASIRTREEMQVQPLYKKIWFLDHIHFQSNIDFDAGAAIKNGFPYFQFLVNMQELDCLVSTKEEDEGKEVIVSGDKGKITNNSYVLTLALHQQPDLEVVGHEWEIIEFQLAETHKMLL